ncbi:iron-containing alcohol dehydrogenase [Neoehrlichia mikurensis]|uniref:Iron-containing alcohol dehydrogenase n=1 Tax=Neoehrlichia mikurensis TaxID=89586 RepID=A0A9Q9F5K7_9RICK|nr:iron-containing alcohol dehydrogenase [Neoehrlichia mikurensis]QXK91621.1 iron-containing alcohol dehydrogenase [Neoehrlichia mikurensis]QXK92832.1 iron-containing alcohol dehydrogenase [Neoehrlichia mikurensis]QXK93312.1 iron-containing alcohol dehydrogenase [Neoehrlichia mikurensis]UTO55746.1 iron-containing alcohol dehydrogenase [Neoehrlichia mikurensis]UTO56663.1 iron-containing alcohol dehydrogenase [Neoehrlichia mikurensis]
MYNSFLKRSLLCKDLNNYLDVIKNVINIIYIDTKLISHFCDIVKLYSSNSFIVADTNTANILGRYAFDMFNHYVIPGKFCASEMLVDLIRSKSKSSDLIVALGSGTINDICKYVSYIENKDYILFPTAPSMNGYTSLNASITMRDGRKYSFNAHLPKAIYIDIDVIVNSPKRLIISGFADFICRSTVRADWLMSHFLLGSDYMELPFIISKESEDALIYYYSGLIYNDKSTIMMLMQALILSGIGMLIIKSSKSASQGEHIIASSIELLDHNNHLLHGEMVGIAMMVMSNLQHKILNIFPKINPTAVNKADIIACFGKKYAKDFWCILSKKMIDYKKAEMLNKIIAEKWSDIVNLINQNILNPGFLKKIFLDIGCPHTIQHTNWNLVNYRQVANLAFVTRDRFTFLDIAHHIGMSVV